MCQVRTLCIMHHSQAQILEFCADRLEHNYCNNGQLNSAIGNPKVACVQCAFEREHYEDVQIIPTAGGLLGINPDNLFQETYDFPPVANPGSLNEEPMIQHPPIKNESPSVAGKDLIELPELPIENKELEESSLPSNYLSFDDEGDLVHNYNVHTVYGDLTQTLNSNNELISVPDFSDPNLSQFANSLEAIFEEGLRQIDELTDEEGSSSSSSSGIPSMPFDDDLSVKKLRENIENVVSSHRKITRAKTPQADKRRAIHNEEEAEKTKAALILMRPFRGDRGME